MSPRASCRSAGRCDSGAMSGLSCPPWASMSADTAVSLLVVTGSYPSMSEIGARRLARPSARGKAGAWPLLRSSPPAGLTYSMGRRPLLASLRPSIPTARRTGNAPALTAWPLPPLAPSFPCPDTGIHAPSSPPFGLLPRGGGLRWGERPTLGLRKWRGRRVHGAMGAPRAVIPVPRHGNPCPCSPAAHEPRRDTRPSHQRPYPPTMPVEACPEPVEGDPRNTRRWRPGLPAPIYE